MAWYGAVVSRSVASNPKIGVTRVADHGLRQKLMALLQALNCELWRC